MINFDDVKHILAETQDQPIFSLYLQVDNSLPENQAEMPGWNIYMKNTLKDIPSPSILEKIEAFFADYQPDSKGLVLFLGENIEKVYKLPVAPLTNEHFYGEMMITPLLWLMDEYERYLIVLVDKEEAHFLTTYLGNIQAEEAIASDRFSFDFREKTLMPRPSMDEGNITAGSNKDRFEAKIDDYIERFHKDAAARIRELMSEVQVDRVVIGGTEESAHAVYRHLHESVLPHVVGVLPIPFLDSDEQIMERVLPIALDYERRKESELVTEVIGQAKSDGRGACGMDAVEDALKMKQVALLVAPYPPEDRMQLHKLTLETIDCGGQVELVHGDAATQLNQEGGIAARLHYTI